jgi:hypothetical protein
MLKTSTYFLRLALARVDELTQASKESAQYLSRRCDIVTLSFANAAIVFRLKGSHGGSIFLFGGRQKLRSTRSLDDYTTKDYDEVFIILLARN